MNLILDIGNTRTKLAFFKENQLLEKAIAETASLAWLSEQVNGKKVEAAILSATGRDTEGVENFLSAHFPFIKLDHTVPIPIQNHYATPETLGRDRLAAVVAAHVLFPKGNHLVIDAGTCITFNFIDALGIFHGGNIAPGLTMRLKAMHHFTAKLPLVERDISLAQPIERQNTVLQQKAYAIWQSYGNTTETAMRNGAQTGILAEVAGFVQMMRQRYKPLNIILTGGDGEFIYKNQPFPRRYFEPNLVLMGLNQILNFNKKTEC
jgi:type III pantothenate kinase